VASEKPEETFKVVDRRLFTADGELRREVLEEENRASEKAATAKPIAAAPPPPPDPAEQQAVEPVKPLPSFRRLVESLAQNAAMLLGGYADPRTGQAMLDLEGSRELIDMLDALREKTKGNLTAEEDRLLLEVLGSLKLSYMEMTKAAAQAMRENAARKS
jgi:hypothetical protein